MWLVSPLQNKEAAPNSYYEWNIENKYCKLALERIKVTYFAWCNLLIVYKEIMRYLFALTGTYMSWEPDKELVMHKLKLATKP